MREDGDMYENQQRFEEFARGRNLENIENWAKMLICPIIKVDGTKDYNQTTIEIVNKINEV